MKENKFTFEIGEGGEIVMKNAKTIGKYIKASNASREVDCYKHKVFFAFSNQQFDENKKKAGIAEGEKICSFGAGMFGTAEGIREYLNEIREKTKERKSCDPQEVYCYEYKEHECMYSFNGDEDAMRIVIELFGKEAARKVKRVRACKTISQMIKSR